MSVCLVIPHTPWIPARVKSMQRLRDQLGKWDGPYLELTERASNKQWPRKMWQWALDSGADTFCTLQDDTLIAPCFWPALRAMLPSVGEHAVLGLSAVHPIGVEIQRQGLRWYRTQSWLVGWAYAMRRPALAGFVAWYDDNPELVARHNEDDLINEWVRASGRTTWHPVPTLVDHDTSIESTYANDSHVHRRASVTWRDYGEGSLTDPDFWLPSGEPPLLPVPAPHECWFCLKRPGHAASSTSGARICRLCVAQVASALIGGG